MSIILIVDDHVPSSQALKQLLSLSGFPAVCVHSGEEALAFARTIRPRLILLDELMPGLSGLETLRRLRGMHGVRDVPVLMYSAVYDAAKCGQATSLGAIGWINKGLLNWAQLCDQIAALSGPRSRAEEKEQEQTADHDRLDEREQPAGPA